MTDDLSRLLDDELDTRETDALEARIARDPELAARWARMQALPGRIRGLSPTIRVPDRLGAGGAPPQRPPHPAIVQRRVSRLHWLGWAAAAALALLMLRPAPTRVLIEGTELVEGRADVLAGGVRVEIDGAARVTVEPPTDGGREVAAEIDPMNVSHLAAALAGSVVTVSVLQGSAWLYPEDAAPTEVRAGETRTVGEPVEVVIDTPSPRAEDPMLAQLRRQVAQLERERAEATGTARRLGGEPQGWPKDPRPALRPEAFERFVDQRAAAIPDVEVVSVDCAEYPCIAVVESLSDAADWEAPLSALHDDLPDSFGDSVQVIGLAAESSTPEGDMRLYAFAVAPAELSEAARARMKARAEAALRPSALDEATRAELEALTYTEE